MSGGYGGPHPHLSDDVLRGKTAMGQPSAGFGRVNFACAPPLSFQQRTRAPGKEIVMPQIRTEQQPVTQITVVEAEPGKQAQALELMTQRAQFMARQPGFVSISLHRSLDGRRIVNYVQWENR